ncbi:MAG TPA: hypothetical protein VKF36_02200 [Syntrophorhabdales bacterium]|nr:hypothetical protein [Syntrophorhabdales bacterium]
MLICTHHTGEPHGILGAQVAATYFSRRLAIPSIVVGLKRDFHKEKFLAFAQDHYQGKERIIGFSHLSGRKEIFQLIAMLHEMGFTTILGGPQALQDYAGEPDADRFPHRFQGLKDRVDIAIQGPVDGVRQKYLKEKNRTFQSGWATDIYLEVDWSNLYTFSEKLEPLEIQVAQVLAAIGCPYARKESAALLDPPVSLADKVPKITIRSYGCIFCDVAWDKGFQGHVNRASLMAQIKGLPDKAGRKIPFELIDEYPITTLQALLDETQEEGIDLSQVNLVCRVDAVTKHAEALTKILSTARERAIRIMFSSIGFESFSEKILAHFNKGVTVAEITECVELLRRLKDEFGDTLLYRRDEGATHGFIHPTPWDDGETFPEMDRNIFIHGLFDDILPDHSTPLIIHHGSALGEWLRQIEESTNVVFGRDSTWIEWWNHT